MHDFLEYSKTGLQFFFFDPKGQMSYKDTIFAGQNKILVGHHQTQKVEFYPLLL